MNGIAAAQEPCETNRFADYCNLVTRRVVEVEASHRGTGRFNANIVERPLGPLRAFHIRSDPVTISRSHRCIARDADNQYIIAFNQSSDCSVSHGSFTLDVPMGAFYLLDKARPYATEFSMPSSRVLVCVPRGLLEQRIGDPAQFLACISPASSGVARIASDFISNFFAESGSLSPFQQGQLAVICLDLLVMTLNNGMNGISSDRHGPQNGITSGRLLLSRIKAHISVNLGDSELTPAAIAQAHRISKRYLHHIFAEAGTSVSLWLREERLLLARALLKSPRAMCRSVTDIAFDCGFKDPAHFSRSFKARFGVTPSVMRSRQMHGPRPE